MIDNVVASLWAQVYDVIIDIDLYLCLVSTYVLVGLAKLALAPKICKLEHRLRILSTAGLAFIIMYLCVYLTFKEFEYVHKLAFFLGITNPLIYGVASKFLVKKYPILEGALKPHREYANRTNTTKPRKK